MFVCAATSMPAAGTSDTSFRWSSADFAGRGTDANTSCHTTSHAHVAIHIGATGAIGSAPDAMSAVPTPWDTKMGPQIANVAPTGVTEVSYSDDINAFVGSRPLSPVPYAALTPRRDAYEAESANGDAANPVMGTIFRPNGPKGEGKKRVRVTVAVSNGKSIP